MDREANSSTCSYRNTEYDLREGRRIVLSCWRFDSSSTTGGVKLEAGRSPAGGNEDSPLCRGTAIYRMQCGIGGKRPAHLYVDTVDLLLPCASAYGICAHGSKVGETFAAATLDTDGDSDRRWSGCGNWCRSRCSTENSGRGWASCSGFVWIPGRDARRGNWKSYGFSCRSKDIQSTIGIEDLRSLSPLTAQGERPPRQRLPEAGCGGP